MSRCHRNIISELHHSYYTAAVWQGAITHPVRNKFTGNQDDDDGGVKTTGSFQLFPRIFINMTLLRLTNWARDFFSLGNLVENR